MTTYIHCLNNISAKGTDLLDESYALTDSVEEASGILVRSAAMHDMEFSENLLAIARAGAGVNNIPLDRAAEEGIVVFNTPGANANAVKELVLAGLLMGSRDIVGGIDWCRANAEDENITKAAEKAKKAFAGREIMGKTLGVIGLGAIGALVANAAIELGMKVVGYDPFISVPAALRLNPAVKVVATLEDIYTISDYITIHVPATADTKGMINAEALAAMKDDVVFLNFSRDTLVNEEAMADALANGKAGKYITDFATPGVMKMTNALAIPHLGASTEEAEENCAMMAVRQMRDFLENGNITNSVNYPAINAGVAEGYRVVILSEATDTLVADITAAFSSVAGIVSKTRGTSAATLVDLAEEPSEDTLAAVADIDGVRLVRAI